MYQNIIRHKERLCAINTKSFFWYDDLPGMLDSTHLSVKPGVIFIYDKHDWTQLLALLQPDLFREHTRYVVFWYAKFTPNFDELNASLQSESLYLYLVINLPRVTKNINYKVLKNNKSDIRYWLEYWQVHSQYHSDMIELCEENWVYARTCILLSRSSDMELSNFINKKSTLPIDLLVRSVLQANIDNYMNCKNNIELIGYDEIPLVLWHLNQLLKYLANDDINWYYAKFIPKIHNNHEFNCWLSDSLFNIEVCYKKQNEPIKVKIMLTNLLEGIFNYISQYKYL